MCNAINYNVRFMDKIHFNVMTMMLIYYWMTREYLFYYCDVNWCYCIVCAVVNLSICRIDRLRIQIQFSIRHCFILMEIQTYCTLHMGIPTEYVCRYIPMIIGTVFFFLALFIMLITYRYTNEMCSLVYSSDYSNVHFLMRW